MLSTLHEWFIIPTTTLYSRYYYFCGTDEAYRSQVTIYCRTSNKVGIWTQIVICPRSLSSSYCERLKSEEVIFTEDFMKRHGRRFTLLTTHGKLHKTSFRYFCSPQALPPLTPSSLLPLLHQASKNLKLYVLLSKTRAGLLGVLILPRLCTDTHSSFTPRGGARPAPQWCVGSWKDPIPSREMGPTSQVAKHTGQLNWTEMVFSFSYLLQILVFRHESGVKLSTRLWQCTNTVLLEMTLLSSFGGLALFMYSDSRWGSQVSTEHFRV